MRQRSARPRLRALASPRKRHRCESSHQPVSRLGRPGRSPVAEELVRWWPRRRSRSRHRDRQWPPARFRASPQKTSSASSAADECDRDGARERQARPFSHRPRERIHAVAITRFPVGPLPIDRWLLKQPRATQSAASSLLSAQTASLGEPRWSCVATRMQVSVRVEADRVCAANRQRQKCPTRSVRLLRVPLVRLARSGRRPNHCSAGPVEPQRSACDRPAP